MGFNRGRGGRGGRGGGRGGKARGGGGGGGGSWQHDDRDGQRAPILAVRTPGGLVPVKNRNNGVNKPAGGRGGGRGRGGGGRGGRGGGRGRGGRGEKKLSKDDLDADLGET